MLTQTSSEYYKPQNLAGIDPKVEKAFGDFANQAQFKLATFARNADIAFTEAFFKPMTEKNLNSLAMKTIWKVCYYLMIILPLGAMAVGGFLKFLSPIQDISNPEITTPNPFLWIPIVCTVMGGLFLAIILCGFGMNAISLNELFTHSLIGIYISIIMLGVSLLMLAQGVEMAVIQQDDGGIPGVIRECSRLNIYSQLFMIILNMGLLVFIGIKSVAISKTQAYIALYVGLGLSLGLLFASAVLSVQNFDVELYSFHLDDINKPEKVVSGIYAGVIIFSIIMIITTSVVISKIPNLIPVSIWLEKQDIQTYISINIAFEIINYILAITAVILICYICYPKEGKVPESITIILYVVFGILIGTYVIKTLLYQLLDKTFAYFQPLIKNDFYIIFGYLALILIALIAVLMFYSLSTHGQTKDARTVNQNYNIFYLLVVVGIVIFVCITIYNIYLIQNALAIYYDLIFEKPSNKQIA